MTNDRNLAPRRDHEEPLGLVGEIDLGMPELDAFLQESQPHALRERRKPRAEEFNLRHSRLPYPLRLTNPERPRPELIF